MRLDVCLTPGEFRAERFSAHTAVVIDVLRATSVIATAMANGCTRLIPVKTVAAARERHNVIPDALLAGEREGLPLPGFDMGNSPAEYSEDKVAGKTVIMTTTNGTAALLLAAKSAQVYTGAFVNAAASCRKIRETGRDAVFVCAGRQGEFSLEDALCAGLLCDRLADIADLSDTAMAVQAMYRDFRSNLVPRVAASAHARYLNTIGYAGDIAYCLEYDLFDVTPRFHDGMIML